MNFQSEASGLLDLVLKRVTLLAAAAGLLSPSAGRITLDGRPLAEIGRQALARRRAYLPQLPRADWPLSVERVVGLGLTSLADDQVLDLADRLVLLVVEILSD